MFLYPHHVTYIVYNIREVADYLEENFGLKPWQANQQGPGLRVLTYRVGQTLMEFLEPVFGEDGKPIGDSRAIRMFVGMLETTGPGIFHIAWAVEGIDDRYKELKDNGLDMDAGGHDHPLHDSFHKWYKVFNILPHSVGPSLAGATRGVFFQCAEGRPSPQDLAERGNLDLSTLPKHSDKPPGRRAVRT